MGVGGTSITPLLLPLLREPASSRLIERSLWVAFAGQSRLNLAAAPILGPLLHAHDESNAAAGLPPLLVVSFCSNVQRVMIGLHWATCRAPGVVPRAVFW